MAAALALLPSRCGPDGSTQCLCPQVLLVATPSPGDSPGSVRLDQGCLLIKPGSCHPEWPNLLPKSPCAPVNQNRLLPAANTLCDISVCFHKRKTGAFFSSLGKAQPVFCLFCRAVTVEASSKELGRRPRTLLRGTLSLHKLGPLLCSAPLC